MSLRKLSPALAAAFLAFILCAATQADIPAAPDARLVPAVQTYAEQAVPVAPPPAQSYYNSPLAAGTLTLQDVLEAHKPAEPAMLPVIGAPTPSATTTAPILTPQTQASSTSLMMSQGMKDVLQKVDNGAAPVQVGPVVGTQALHAPTPLVPAETSAPVAGIQYQPGQAPKNLGNLQTGTPASSAAPVAAGSSVPAATGSSTPAAPPALAGGNCDEKVQKWEKTCGDAGYPANYLGQIVGETHTGCADGALHDIWVSNSCVPPENATADSPKVDAVCGPASNNEFDATPAANLCAQGMASAVSGEGPWTWACSGANGGNAAACTARKREPISNGICGGANGAATDTAPIDDLCTSGAPSEISGSGPWTWQCKGRGNGSSESCIAPRTAAAMAAGAAAAVVAANPAPAESKPVASKPAVAEKAAVAATQAPAAAPTEKGELCGEAAETLAYQAPEKDLCRVGNASAIDGEGPWTWSCTDNDGRSSHCRTLSLTEGKPAAEEAAPVKSAAETAAALPEPEAAHARGGPRVDAVPPPAPVSTELTCGIAASQGTLVRPAAELCVNGKASSVRGSGPWRWTCTKGKHKVACETPKIVDGSCGAANGTALKSAPFAGLCSAGTPTGIEGNGPWTWSCAGTGGGVNVSCAASRQGRVDGTCGSSANTVRENAPSEGLCSTGTASDVNGAGPWTWSCSGAAGGGVSSCAATKVAATEPPGPKVGGLCGTANGLMATSAPTEGLCANGTVTPVVGDGPWNWSCLGENGGMTVSCTAPMQPPAPIDGICGQASGIETLVKPEGGLCASGITGTVSGRGPWTWTCSGVNGGSPVSCVAPVAGRSSATPSVTTAGSPLDSTANDANAKPITPKHNGLVTPHLPAPKAAPAYDDLASPPAASSQTLETPKLAGKVAESDTSTLEDSGMVSPPLDDSAIKETEGEHAAHIAGNHLTLDPTISTVLFTRGSGNIDETVLTTLDKLSSVLTSNPDVRITLLAYADNAGSSPRDARRLSLTRALAVRDYLAAHGVATSRVDVRAEGANTTSGYIDRVDVKVND
ncbi:MAG: OmpA family protein [Alphaproteobacteria bacterium]|nr:OmpA family protein [Alphaproteobacteria bacterium]